MRPAYPARTSAMRSAWSWAESAARDACVECRVSSFGFFVGSCVAQPWRLAAEPSRVYSRVASEASRGNRRVGIHPAAANMRQSDRQSVDQTVSRQAERRGWRSLGTWVLYALPLLTALVIGFAIFVVGAPQSYRAARVWGGPT